MWSFKLKISNVRRFNFGQLKYYYSNIYLTPVNSSYVNFGYSNLHMHVFSVILLFSGNNFQIIAKNQLINMKRLEIYRKKRFRLLNKIIIRCTLL